MSKFPSLTLVVPRLFERTPAALADEARLDAGTSDHSGNDSLLAHLAGRGDVARRWHATQPDEARLAPWQRGLLAAVQLDEQRYPSAALSALGQGFIAADCDWFHAEPIHLAAGLNEVRLVPLTPAVELTRAERDSMTVALQEHVAAENWTLRPCGANAWLIGAPDVLDVRTVTPEFARRNEWNAVLPQGAGAPRLRRLMTELQMLLHEHPVNDARSARGLPVVNSLWFWGNGQPQAAASRAAFECIGDNDYLRGICALNGWQTPPAASSAAIVLERARATGALVCVLDDLNPQQLERDWLAACVAALKRGHLDRLELVLDEWLLTIDRWRLRRFWRRSLPLQAWAAG